MFELVMRAPQRLVEPVSEWLLDGLGALSVAVEDADAGGAGEHALFGEPGYEPPPGWERSSLTALFETELGAEQAAAMLISRHGDAGVCLQALQPLAERDWVRLTQSQFAPLEITPELWVVPSWHRPPAAAQHVVRLDPGLAFGTGSHATTRMCLRWLARRPPDASLARVLDYGCGSGILAIAAVLLGAGAVDAVDIDPAAVRSTRDNALLNGVAVAAGPPEQARGPYSVVLANILATPLKLLAPLLAGHLAPGSWLVLAGILERQAGEIEAAYRPWLRLREADRDDGWVLMCARCGAAAV